MDVFEGTAGWWTLIQRRKIVRGVLLSVIEDDEERRLDVEKNDEEGVLSDSSLWDPICMFVLVLCFADWFYRLPLSYAPWTPYSR
jgi:hypothetical protein